MNTTNFLRSGKISRGKTTFFKPTLLKKRQSTTVPCQETVQETPITPPEVSTSNEVDVPMPKKSSKVAPVQSEAQDAVRRAQALIKENMKKSRSTKSRSTKKGGVTKKRKYKSKKKTRRHKRITCASNVFDFLKKHGKGRKKKRK